MRSPRIREMRIIHENGMEETGLGCLERHINGTTGMGRLMG